MEPSFSRRVIELACLIPPGRVTTYGALAQAAGGGRLAARSISRILSRAPNQRAIPWHRIVYAGGTAWLSSEHEAARRHLYQKENIRLDDRGRIQDFDDIFYDFTAT